MTLYEFVTSGPVTKLDSLGLGVIISVDVGGAAVLGVGPGFTGSAMWGFGKDGFEFGFGLTGDTYLGHGGGFGLGIGGSCTIGPDEISDLDGLSAGFAIITPTASAQVTTPFNSAGNPAGVTASGSVGPTIGGFGGSVLGATGTMTVIKVPWKDVLPTFPRKPPAGWPLFPWMGLCLTK
jgi:hypothetical protein